jgi:hypothetical protein
MLQRLPGGLCFAHGPYDGMTCPNWPSCAAIITNIGPDPRWVKLAEERRVNSVKNQIKNLVDSL